MKNLVFLAFLFFSIQAFAQEYKTKLLSDTQKSTCSKQEVKRLIDDLDEDSEEFVQLIFGLTKGADLNNKAKLDEQMEIGKRAIEEKSKVLNNKRQFLYQNCGINYKSPRTRKYEAENAQKALERRRESYKPEDAYKPDVK